MPELKKRNFSSNRFASILCNFVHKCLSGRWRPHNLGPKEIFIHVSTYFDKNGITDSPLICMKKRLPCKAGSLSHRIQNQYSVLILQFPELLLQPQLLLLLLRSEPLQLQLLQGLLLLLLPLLLQPAKPA